LDETGFVFAPFDGNQMILIPKNQSVIWEADVSSLTEQQAVKIESSENQKEKERFESLIQKAVEAIKRGDLKKVVLSRKEILEVPNFDLVAAFTQLIQNFPTVFCYCWYHPKIGLWMGATPERLLKINQDQFETVALAGTQLYSENVIWATKEIEEQQFVTDYIVTKVKDKVNSLIISDAKTVKAGNLAHLKSFISGELTADFQANDLMNSLHPTPAVCGLPKEKAIDFILKNEGYNRKYYAGFLGEYNKDNQTDLFVNLRCLEVENDVVNIYVGCGITKDSNPEKEFIETENKSMTMRNVLVKSKK